MWVFWYRFVHGRFSLWSFWMSPTVNTGDLFTDASIHYSETWPVKTYPVFTASVNRCPWTGPWTRVPRWHPSLVDGPWTRTVWIDIYCVQQLLLQIRHRTFV